MQEETGKPKYLILMEALKQNILSGVTKPGDKLPSENELSVSYDVSRHTVRKALSMLASEGYVGAEHGKGTFCLERSHHMKSSKNIGLIITYISDYIFPRMIQGIDRVLTDAGYSIILKNTGNSRTNEKRALEDMLEKDIDGLIIEPSKSHILCKHMHLFEALETYEIPYILMQGVYPQMKKVPNIVLDDSCGGYLLTKYLLDIGHRNIAGIFKADDMQGQGRHRGYAKALMEAGVPYDPDLVVWFYTEDRRKKPGLMIASMIRQQMEMDGVVCYNDQIAMEVMRSIRKAGLRIPEDISVTGFDNSVLSRNGFINLTTVTHPQEKYGEMAARLLLEQIQKVPEEESKVERIVKPELIVRESTMPRAVKPNI